VQGMMQAGPLTLDVIFRRAETLWPSKQLLTATLSGVGVGRLRTMGAAHSPTRDGARRAGRLGRRPRRDLRLEHRSSRAP
jgi:hypothetical protein